MKHYKKVLVGLDFSNGDKSLINYVKFLNDTLRPEAIHFLNVQEKIDIPEDVLEQFPQLREDIKKTFVSEMERETSDFNIVGTDLIFEMVSGHVIEGTLDYAQANDIDLLVLGRKKDLKKSSFQPERLAREFNTDTVLVPTGSAANVTKVMVNIDFSSYSKLAIENLVIDALDTGYSILAHHIYEVPTGFEKTGKSFEEFSAIMKDNAEKEFKRFIAKVDTKGVEVTGEFSCGNDKEFSDIVMKKAELLNVDLITVAARGRTEAAALFLGSTTEELIQADSEIPLLITRDKAREFGIWEAFKKLL